MVSVIANWQGQCQDHALQSEFVSHLTEIAAFSQALVAPAHAIDCIDGVLDGPVVAAPGLLSAKYERAGDGLGRLPSVSLYGLQFEPPFAFKRYHGHCRLNLMFIRAPHDPLIDGRLVRVVTGEDLALYDNASVRASRVYLTSPSIHLRYQFEAWVDLLMDWAKTFFVQDLSYWRHDDKLQPDGPHFAPRDLDRRERQWKAVKQAYATEAGHYRFPAMRSAARATGDLPWVWLAGRILAYPEAAHLSRAVRAAVPRDRWPFLRRASVVAVLKAGQGANLDYMSVAFGTCVFALSSRLKSEGLFVDIDVAPSIPPRHIIRAANRKPEIEQPQSRSMPIDRNLGIEELPVEPIEEAFDVWEDPPCRPTIH